MKHYPLNLRSLAKWTLTAFLSHGFACAEDIGGNTTAPGDRKVYDHGNPTDQEQLMLELINRARANPKAEADRLGIDLNSGLAPGSITTAPKPPLSPHPALFLAARRHSRWMLDTDIFSHTGNDDSGPGDRMIAAGYRFSGSWSWAENIAWGGTSGTPDINRETAFRHEGLFRSPGHRGNLLSPNNTNIGLGILAGRFENWNAVMATQTFARSSSYPEAQVLGVVFKDNNGNGFYDPGEGIPGVTVLPDSGTWKAVTAQSGGYAVPYSGTSGWLSLTFSGGLLLELESRTVEKTGNNLKVDFSITGPISSSPEIQVRQPADTLLRDGKSRKNFGSVKVGSGKRTMTFTIRNTGTASLSELRVVKSGSHRDDFTITSPAKTSVPPGKSVTFKVTFKPKAVGTRGALLRIMSNDTDKSPFRILLSGAGTRQ